MEFKECCIEGHVYVPHAICNGQVLPSAAGIDMIDSSPGVSGRVGALLPAGVFPLEAVMVILSQFTRQPGVTSCSGTQERHEFSSDLSENSEMPPFPTSESGQSHF